MTFKALSPKPKTHGTLIDVDSITCIEAEFFRGQDVSIQVNLTINGTQTQLIPATEARFADIKLIWDDLEAKALLGTLIDHDWTQWLIK